MTQDILLSKMVPNATYLAEIYDPSGRTGGSSTQISEFEQRINILQSANISPGSKILEIGCGQGDCTLLLADLVGDEGHVTGIDPASPDYGSPITLGQSQTHLKKSPLGRRITFHQADLETFLKSTDAQDTYDYAVFVHCILYFSSPELLGSMLASLRGRAKRVVIAEYAFDVQGDLAALPHLLAALSQAELCSRRYARGLESSGNIRSLATPPIIRNISERSGWSLKRENIVTHSDGLLEGKWEANYVLSNKYYEMVKSEPDERQRLFAEGMLDVIRGSVQSLGTNGKVRSMPSWVSVWE